MTATGYALLAFFAWLVLFACIWALVASRHLSDKEKKDGKP